ncbi:serine/threonine protein kinase -likeprotein-like protein [Rhodopirellula islandica]|uniref:Serine/threonine protein kinase-likeprotein-like protein n=1 Tax=Rhodopirellula islandica TaxID=595434 RepID=A0A0J1B4E7_RHOIS|nr:PQQ-binding-like beta-propeller repeat protein [Rhodopirellula islandica]KLU01473.1 serine/threonine protein kinase -likeprotein-like protein [Rhodopirellula islandica]
MHRFSQFRLILSFTLVAACALGGAASALADHQLLGPVETRQLGLEEVWRRSLSVPAGRQSIVDQQMVVHETQSHVFVEIVQKSGESKPAAAEADAESTENAVDENAVVYARFQVDTDLTKRGAIDQAEAERLGRNEILRLKRRGIEAKSRIQKVPMIRFYTLSDDGTVECRDAESGDLIWLQRVGSEQRGYGGLGVDEAFVSVVNGGELIKLDVKNGQVFGVTSLEYVPLRGVVHCNGFALVPSIGDRIVCYGLVDPTLDPFAEIVAGSSLAVPTHAADSNKVAWGTSRGFVYVMEMEGEPNVQFRLNTDGIVSGSPAAASGERFFFGSESGQIYGIKATREGEVLWSRPTGEPIYSSPIFYNEKVLYPTIYGNLMCVSASDGYSVWPQMVPGVQELLGAIDGKIYARSLSGSLLVMSAEDGKLLGRFPGIQPEALVVNRHSDRLYLVNDRGTMQCLRRPGSVLPKVLKSTAPVETEEESEVQLETTKPKETAPENADPFGGGGGADPFGGAMEDPFAPAGGQDPFGDF